MKIRYKKYSSNVDTSHLVYVEKGTGILYRAIKRSGKKDVDCEYVTLDLGGEQIMLDINDFTEAVNAILNGGKNRVRNVVKLKLVGQD